MVTDAVWRTWTATGGSISWSSGSGCRSRSSGTRRRKARAAQRRAGSRRATDGGIESSPATSPATAASTSSSATRGLNSRLRATRVTSRSTMYVKDFDGNGSFEQILSVPDGQANRVLPLRDDLLRALRSFERDSRPTPRTRGSRSSRSSPAPSWEARSGSARGRSRRRSCGTTAAADSRSSGCRTRHSSRRSTASSRPTRTATGTPIC